MADLVVALGVQVGLVGHLLNIVLYGTWLGIVVSRYTKPGKPRKPLALALLVGYFLGTIAATAFAVIGATYFDFISTEDAQVVFRFVRLFAGLLMAAYTVDFLLERAEWRH
jgi:predicted outer membrane lipoprotein